MMRSSLERLARILVVATAFALSGLLAHKFGSGGLWQGFSSALAIARPGEARSYDLTRLEAVNETLKYVRDRYVDPNRVRPREMLMSALNHIQRDVAEVIVLPQKDGTVTVRVDTHERQLRVDNVLGPWDVAAKLREVFAFLQQHLQGRETDLREIEYAACNGILRTLDPHSVFLSPDAYKEMNLSTSGHFGGLGIVISIRDQLLTIIRPMPGTPAARAGLKKYDRVMKIDNESTLNMPLDDAVRRLRGKPGTTVNVWVAREGDWEGTRKFLLTRERIEVPSVVSRRLAEDVGYVRLKQFQQTSTKEIRSALGAIRQEGELRALVLDLRGNPGGLLEQAAQVADVFLESGMIVATVGESEGREEKRAVPQDTEPAYPMVVLVNSASASASEIVAGALRHLDRAVIVGQATFGKGSVQLVFPDVTPDKAALKLTIAQYLTPGDTSIQGVGVTPHIELDPMTVDTLEMDLTVSDEALRERDLSQHLASSRPTKPAKPEQVVRYYLSQQDRTDLRERGGELEDEFQLDYPIELARQLARRLPPGKGAAAQLRAVTGFIEEARNAEIAKVTTELAKIGVDWAIPATKPAAGPSTEDFEVKIETDRPGNEVLAGEPIHLVVTVTNKAATPIYRLRATTESDNPYFDEKELVFGKIGPGESKSAKTPLSWCEVEGRRPGSTRPLAKDAKRLCRVPMDALERQDAVKVHFDASGGQTPPSVEIRPTIRALPRALFQYSYQISDAPRGNGDGLVQRGESITMLLTVQNIGDGRSHETQANLANRSGDGVLLRDGRFDISNMMPGDVRHVAFTFDVEPQLKEDEVVLGLSVVDRDLREQANEKIRIPLRDAVAVTPLGAGQTAVTTTSDALLYPDALGSGEPFGRVRAGATLAAVGRAGELVKVQLDGQRFAFVRRDASRAGGAPPSGAVAFDTIYRHAPPKLAVKASALATRDERVKIKVDATDSERVLDLYLFVGPRKLHYLSNRNGADPLRASFEFDAPLQPGVNVITVVARENADTTTRRTVVVRRDGADGSILKTPKHDDDYLLEPAE
jgi:carboxyl-terminal processing protease